MKITYLSSPISSQYGGGEKFLDDFTTGIDAEHEFIGSSKAVYDLFYSKSYKITLISGLFEPVSPRNILLIPISILVGLLNFIRFYKTFKHSDWIISPTANCETFFVIPWIKLILRKKVLFMVHNGNVPKVFRMPPFNFLLSKCWGDSTVVFVSHSQKETWNRAGCLPGNQIVIYNGVEVSELNLVPKNSEIIKLGFIGRLNKEKGCDILINSLTLIISNQNIEIIVVGEGDQKQELLDLLSTISVPGNIKVKFIGFQVDTKAFYESIDLLVSASRRESFGLVICEAMEQGVSVLCSNIPSSLELKKVIDLSAESELIFQMDNPQDLAVKIDYFVENRGFYLNSKYKQKLHNVVVEKFSLERMIVQYDKVLSIIEK